MANGNRKDNIANELRQFILENSDIPTPLPVFRGEPNLKLLKRLSTWEGHSMRAVPKGTVYPSQPIAAEKSPSTPTGPSKKKKTKGGHKQETTDQKSHEHTLHVEKLESLMLGARQVTSEFHTYVLAVVHEGSQVGGLEGKVWAQAEPIAAQLLSRNSFHAGKLLLSMFPCSACHFLNRVQGMQFGASLRLA